MSVRTCKVSFRWIVFFALAAFALPAADAVSAQDGAEPVLSVYLNGGTIRHFTPAQLDDLGQEQVHTSTPWHEGVVSFSGPLLRSVAAANGLAGRDLTVRALNNYEAIVPANDIKSHRVILATRMNGERMSIREQGPFFVIYPFDDDPVLKSEIYYARSVWQVRELKVD